MMKVRIIALTTLHCTAVSILNSYSMVFPTMSEIITVERYKKAFRQIMITKERQGFKIHAIVYGCVNACLIMINMLTEPQVPWFVFPLVGWGIGLANHYYFGVHKYLQTLEKDELKAERMAEREQQQ